jgi:hypothetical protein
MQHMLSGYQAADHIHNCPLCGLRSWSTYVVDVLQQLLLHYEKQQHQQHHNHNHRHNHQLPVLQQQQHHQ